MMPASLFFYFGIALLIAGVLLVLVRAFQDRFIWGLGVILLFPLLYPLYSLLKFSDLRVRNGFMLSIAAALLCAVALYGGAGNDIPIEEVRELAEKMPVADPPKEPLPNEEEAAQVELPDEEHYDPIERGNELEVVKIQPLAPSEDKHISVKNTPVEKSYRTITLHEANQFMDEAARVTLVDGSQKQGRLMQVTDKSITLEQTVTGGAVSLEYTYKNIERLEVLSARRAVDNEAPEIVTPPGDLPELVDDIIDSDSAIPPNSQPQTDETLVQEPAGIELPEGVIETPIPGTEKAIFPPEAIPHGADIESQLQDPVSDIDTGDIRQPVDKNRDIVDSKPIAEPEHAAEIEPLPAE